MIDYQILKEKASDFGEIARKVNESSEIRKTYSEEAVKYISMLKDIGEILLKEIKSVAEANVKHRDYDNKTQNACFILKYNIDRQQKIIEELNNEGVISEKLKDSLSGVIISVLNTIEDVSANLKEIIENDNRIIFKDTYLYTLKNSQIKALSNLSELTELILTDAKKATEGSAANLKRGLDLAEQFKSVDKLIESGDRNKLEKLFREASAGKETALSVNSKSVSQLEFSEKVNRFTGQLLEDTMYIKEIVTEKHALFEANLQIITVLTVLVSLDLKKYLEIEKLVDQIDYIESSGGRITALNQLVKIAVEDVKLLTSQNYDITESIQKNNELETKTVSMTESEVDYYNRITTAVAEMTSAAGYPAEGSAENIENAGILERELEKIISSL